MHFLFHKYTLTFNFDFVNNKLFTLIYKKKHTNDLVPKEEQMISFPKKNGIKSLQFTKPVSVNYPSTGWGLVTRESIETRTYEAGSDYYEWDGTEFGSGIYFYKLETQSYTETKKIIMLK